MIEVLEIEKLREQALLSENALKINEIATAISGNAEKRADIKGLSSKRSDIYHVNPFLLKIKPGFNCRNFDDEENRKHIRELAESIATKGVIRPLIVHMDKNDEKLYVVDGECRLLAALHAIENLGASIETVPTQVEVRGTNEVERLASQVNYNSGKQLTALELAENIKRLLAFGWDGSKITKETNTSLARQYQLLELAGVPEEVKILIKSGEVSPSLARKTVKALKGDATEALQEAVVVAKAANRKKVTPKDIEPKKMTPQRAKSFCIKTISGLFERAEIQERDEDGAILVKFKEHEQVFMADEFDAIKSILEF